MGDKEDKEYMAVKINSMIRTALHFFFSASRELKTWFELSRVSWYRNDLKGNENYFEVNSGRFELSRVWVTKGKIVVNLWRNPGEIDFG